MIGQMNNVWDKVAWVILSLTSLAYYAVWPKKKIQHNKCHTDNMKIEDLHGHTEPHI